jgi:serine/threonine protein kinase
MTGAPSRSIGRYLLFGEIAAGGMASVCLGRLSGPAGFARTVAIKCLHPQYAKDPEFVAMFLDEARLAARIRHPNVVPTLDIVETDGEIFLVMEYVQGASLARLLRAAKAAGTTPDPRLLTSVLAGVLHGLHAAHEATSELGTPLDIVHRDVSPQNVLVGVDGVARVLDFGVAKAEGRIQTTRDGQVKGKFAYMAPEQLTGRGATRRSDVFSLGVVAWEALTGEKLFKGDNEGAVINAALNHRIPAPSEIAPGLPRELDDVLLRALARDPARRYGTAREMAMELERHGGTAPASEVGAWVDSLVHAELAERAARIAEIEMASSPALPRVPRAPSSPRHGGDPHSDVSSIAVAPSDSDTPAPRSRLAVAASTLAVACVAILVAALLMTRGRGGEPSVAATSEAVRPSAQPATNAPSAQSPPPTPSALTQGAPAPPVPVVQVTDLPVAEPSSMPGSDPALAPDPGAAATPPGAPAGGAGGRARPSGRPASPPPRPDARGAGAPPPAAGAPQQNGSCDPPYWIDAQGHTRYKPACL